MIRLEKLSAGYGGAPVLHDITLRVHKGDFLAVIGPNGCGKSTLLRTAAGLNPHYTGEIFLDGRPLTSWPRMEMSRFAALLPQTREIPSMDVQTLVAHGRFPYCGVFRRLSENDFRKINDALDALGILDLRYANIRELSGGERQKAFLAMMLAQDAQILLLDEPTTYLDAGCQLEILEILRLLNRRGKTVIAVLHDLNHAFNLANRVALLENGRLIGTGTPDELIQSGKVDSTFHVNTKVLNDGEKKYYAFEAPSERKDSAGKDVSAVLPSTQEELYGIYAFYKNLYTTPISSYIPPSEGCLFYYEITADSLTVIDKEQGTTKKYTAMYEKKAVDENTFAVPFSDIAVIPDITKYKDGYQYAVFSSGDSLEYRLYSMDDEVWLATFSGKDSWLRSLYKIIRTSEKP